MVNKLVLEQYDIKQDEIEKELEEIIGSDSLEKIEAAFDTSIKNFDLGTILSGRILGVIGNNVILDTGYKSEGIVPLSEFDSPEEVEVGTDIEVMLESFEDDTGLIQISKRKADRIRGWEKIVNKYQEGDVVKGKVVRKIKGGLLVDVGIPIFLPASQIDIKPPGEIAEYIGSEVTCKILKIDEIQQNIIVSRRKLIEEERNKQKREFLDSVEIGQVVKGEVKNIADFGAFIDLGGIDGLLHITDMSWGRISHPSEMLAIGDEIDVKILDIDAVKDKVSLGLKQKTENPWTKVEERYPIGSKIKGQVVNIMSYGAFIKLETGIEGLVHISEMSWTRRINHPSDVVAIGDSVEAVVLNINKDKEEISLSIKQVEQNPWTNIEEKYPPGVTIKGKVRNLTNYGAFIEIDEGIDGLLHISDMSWSKKVAHPSEIIKKGEMIEVKILSVDKDKKRVSLGIKQLSDDPWKKEIPEKYHVGDIVKGKVTKMTDFGAFIDLSNGLEGLLHISEVSKEKIKKLENVISIGQELDVKIVKIEPEARKIGLSLRGIENTPEQAPESGQQEEKTDVNVTENVAEEKADDVKDEDNT
ncbi:30S ribosomal protein S1 [Candidatus Scalindua japonica]|uniref:30S ribosomal protein S1 n=1 Tax=Candidatus Scalindua japonica TaxID=1284222 RepID=A0A286TYW8_9BACT|nr:30S ribosomal protein S1 [Candidatus Scalindua japonica]GAX61064.1 30S ribosomal protein S1 [Candidatus Scalindua japonica]